MISSSRTRRALPLPLPPAAAARASAVCYAANCALGAAVAARLVDTGRFRWVHHALYIATATTTVLAVVTGLARDSRLGLTLAPSLVPLAIIPFSGTRTRRHPLIALSAAPFLIAGALTARP